MTDSTEHWIARVVRQMEGCSPSKIDSVIQANLPHREIHWSQCPDTLCIPGLEGRLPYSIVSLKWEYDPGFFRGNKLMQPEMPALSYGLATKPLVQPHSHHDIMLGVVILCFAMLSVLVNCTRGFLQTRAHDFFHATGSLDIVQNDKDTAPAPAVVAAYLLLCIIGALFVLLYAQETHNLTLCSIPIYALLAVYAGCLGMMFLAKKMLSGFINWIFFDRNKRYLWHLDYDFLLVAEACALLPVAAAGICFELPTKTVILVGLSVVILVKILLLYKAFEIFIPKIYGILHLLSYLCALEIIPILALGACVYEITEHLTIISF